MLHPKLKEHVEKCREKNGNLIIIAFFDQLEKLSLSVYEIRERVRDEYERRHEQHKDLYESGDIVAFTGNWSSLLALSTAMNIIDSIIEDDYEKGN